MTFPSVKKTVLIGLESSTAWGTAVTADRDIGLVQDISENLSRELIETSGLGAIETQGVYTGNMDNSASVTLQYQHGRLFQYILGTVAHTNSGADWKHTFTVQDRAPSFTMETGEEGGTTDAVLIHGGNLIENAELSIGMNEVVTLKADMKNKVCTSTQTGLSAASVSTLTTFPANITTVSFDGVAATEVQNWSMKFEKKVEKSWGLQSITPQQGHAVELRFAFNGSLGFTDDTYQNLFLGGTIVSSSADPTRFYITMAGDNGTAYGSGQRNFTLTFTGCHMDKLDKAASVGGLVFIEVSGRGTFESLTTVDNLTDTGTW